MKISGVTTLLFFFFLPAILFSQDENMRFVSSGALFGKIYVNYHYHFKDSKKGYGAFEMTRCMLGYEYRISPKLSATIAADAVSTTSSVYTLYVKCAHIDWEIVKAFKLSVGIIDMTQFSTQEKHWGYRYVMKSFQDEYCFGASNDVGISSEIRLHKKIKANIFLVNGEGNKKFQDEFGMHRYGGNVVVTPFDALTLKLAADVYPGHFGKFGDDGHWGVYDTCSINIFSAFLGYSFKEKIRLGAEYNLMQNAKNYSKVAEDYQLSGFSGYATYIFSKKWEVFARYDHLESNCVSRSDMPWNADVDGDLALIGIQYTHIKGFNVSLNYRSWIFSEKESENSFVYLNLGYAF